MADQIQVVYSASTGRIRSIVVPTVPGETIACNLLPGEAVLPMDLAFAKNDLATLQTALNQITKLSPPSDRHALVDANNVVQQIVSACPDCDTPPPGMQFVQTDSAGPGWTYDSNAKTFSNPQPDGPAPDPTPKPLTADAALEAG